MNSAALLPAVTPASVVAAGPADRGSVIEILVAAFAHDPVVRWLYPDETSYLLSFPAIINALGGRAFAHGGVFQTANRRAAALWLPDGVSPDDAAIEAIVRRSLEGETRSTAFAIFEQMGHAHPPGPHWYLPFIGVYPAFQGSGLGSALLEASLARCDAAGLPAYLESTHPRNVPLYRRYGFQVSGEIQAGDCPPLVPMIRPRRR
ncbi:MAG: GNAT family N-acetyltransferase [Opitutaceae bacterium]|nr:GNAT family N-acetyltransferase [Opitutaceae bacterium]